MTQALGAQALAGLHFGAGFFSPWTDQVEIGNCCAIDAATHLKGGWLCRNGTEQFIVSDAEFADLENTFGDYHRPEALVGLGRRNSII